MFGSTLLGNFIGVQKQLQVYTHQKTVWSEPQHCNPETMDKQWDTNMQ